MAAVFPRKAISLHLLLLDGREKELQKSHNNTTATFNYLQGGWVSRLGRPEQKEDFLASRALPSPNRISLLIAHPKTFNFFFTFYRSPESYAEHLFSMLVHKVLPHLFLFYSVNLTAMP